MITTPKFLRLLAFTPVTASRPLFVFLPGMDGSGALLQPQVAELSTGFDRRSQRMGRAERASRRSDHHGAATASWEKDHRLW